MKVKGRDHLMAVYSGFIESGQRFIFVLCIVGKCRRTSGGRLRELPLLNSQGVWVGLRIVTFKAEEKEQIDVNRSSRKLIAGST